MQFLAVVRRRTEAFSDEQFAEFLDPEAARVREMYAQESVREAFSRGDVAGAVLRIEAGSESEARAALASLPFHQRDMIEVEALIPLRPYRGFA